MARGRTPTTSETRVMLEILLNPDRAVFAVEIANEVDIGKERVRQICKQLDDKGYIEIKSVSGRNLYRITDEGLNVLADELRTKVN